MFGLSYDWLPLSLAYQFKRFPNVYFALMSVLACFSFSPKEEWSFILTFTMILLADSFKEMYEDYFRWRSDNQTNGRQVLCMKAGRAKLDMTAWKDVKTGDVVVIEKDQEVPADVVVLGSPSFAGTMAIDTANLDGETSLKLKKAVQSVNAEVCLFRSRAIAVQIGWTVNQRQ